MDIITGATSIGMLIGMCYLASQMEPWCYYVPWTLKQFYKVHKNINTRFSDIIGCDNIKLEISAHLRMFESNKKISKGFIFTGPSGTGKTMMARAIASESGLPFVEVFTSNVSNCHIPTILNKVIFKHAPCIIFIDECDSVLQSCIDTLLRKLDGIDSIDGVFFIMATSQSVSNAHHNNDKVPVFINKGLTRSGRLDKVVQFKLPTTKERLEFFYKMGLNVQNINELVSTTNGFSQADLSIIPREIELTKDITNIDDVNECINLVINNIKFGRESTRNVMSEELKSRIAYHEIGHALVSYSLNDITKVTSVSIENIGSLLGHTTFSNDEDIIVNTKTDLIKRCCMLLASSVFEEYYCGEYSTVCESDFKQIDFTVKLMARCRMITVKATSEKSLFNTTNELCKMLKDEIKHFITANHDLIFDLYSNLIELECIRTSEFEDIINNKLNNTFNIEQIVRSI